MSMRETENEINLLLPGGSLFDPVYGQPAWSFAASDDESGGADRPGRCSRRRRTRRVRGRLAGGGPLMTGTQHRRRVGTVRPSHLMFTGGVGALIDLPNFPVLVRGLDDWRFDTVPDWTPLHEPRLLAAVGKLLGAPVAATAAAALDGRVRRRAERPGGAGSAYPSRRSRSGCGARPATGSRRWTPATGGSRTTRPADRTRPGSSTRTARDVAGSRSRWPRGSCWPASTGTWTTSRTGSSSTAAAPAPR